MKTAIYARISKDQRGDSLGVDRQEQACRELAAAQGWEVSEDHVFRENDTSATVGERRMFEAMLRAVKHGEVQAVVAFKTDRLVRRIADMLRLWEVVEEAHATVMTVTRDLDTTTPTGRSHALLWSVLAEIEVANLRQRLQAKNEQARQQGRVTNAGRRPFGWQMDRKRLHDVEAPALLEAALRVIDGDSLTGVARDLNGRGIGTSYGKRWTASDLRDVLARPRLCGHVTYQGEIVTGPDGAPVAGVWDSILTPEQFDALQVALMQRRKVSDRWVPDRRHLLSGSMLRCWCGQKTLAFHSSSGSTAYRCRGHLARSRDHVDRVVLERVRDFAREHPIEVTSWESEQRADLSDEIRQVEQQLADMEDNFLTSGGDAARLGRMTAVLDERLAALRAERMDRLATETATRWIEFDLHALLGESASLMPHDTDLQQAAKTARLEEQRAAVSLYVEKITLRPSTKRGRFFDDAAVDVQFRDPSRMTWRGIVETG